MTGSKHDYTLKMYAGINHQNGIPLGNLVSIIWNDGKSTLHMEMMACQKLLNEGHYSKVEIIDHVDGSMGQIMRPIREKVQKNEKNEQTRRNN